METEEETLTESAVESEDLRMSDEEDAAVNEEHKTIALLNIDYNSRLISDASLLNPSGGSNSNFDYEKENNTAFFCTNDDTLAEADCEEFEFSDEDLPPSKSLQKINLDDVSCFGINRSVNSDSTYHQSCTTFKDECETEYLSGDENDAKVFNSSSNCRRRLSGGLSLVETISDMNDKQKQGSISIGKSFSNSIFMKNIYLSSTEEQTPLMTCLEFLKAEYSDEELTDIEEYSVKSDDGNEIAEEHACNLSDISFKNSKHHDANASNNVLRHRELTHCGSPENVRRKSSLTVELLSEDEATNLENEERDIVYRRSIKKLSYAEEFANDCPTDEESLDLDNKEWSETDESGCVRQVTVVKTKTSINFEGDGDGEPLDSDDLVSSTTTTTTTRVVTSVISDPDVQSEVESSFVQQLSGDDIRQSCEITFSDTIHDTSRPDE